MRCQVLRLRHLAVHQAVPFRPNDRTPFSPKEISFLFSRLWLYAIASGGYRLLMAVSIRISSARMTPLWLAVALYSAERGLPLVCQSVTGPLYARPRLRVFVPTDITFRGDSVQAAARAKLRLTAPAFTMLHFLLFGMAIPLSCKPRKGK